MRGEGKGQRQRVGKKQGKAAIILPIHGQIEVSLDAILILRLHALLRCMFAGIP